MSYLIEKPIDCCFEEIEETDYFSLRSYFQVFPWIVYSVYILFY